MLTYIFTCRFIVSQSSSSGIMQGTIMTTSQSPMPGIRHWALFSSKMGWQTEMKRKSKSLQKFLAPFWVWGCCHFFVHPVFKVFRPTMQSHLFFLRSIDYISDEVWFHHTISVWQAMTGQILATVIQILIRGKKITTTVVVASVQ